MMPPFSVNETAAKDDVTLWLPLSNVIHFLRNPMKTIGYGIALISIPFFLLMYIGDRLILSPQIASPFDHLGWVLLFSALLITPVNALVNRLGVENKITDIIAWIGFIFLGYLSLVFAFLVIRDVMWAGGAGVHKFILSDIRLFSEASADPVSSRSHYIAILKTTNLGIFVIAGILTLYGVYDVRRIPSVKEVIIPCRNLPGDLERLTIVQITDFHVSATLKGNWVKGVVDTVNRLSPDLVFFTGDIADGSVKRLAEDVAPLADLTARYGCFYVTGNHDYYSGIENWLPEIKHLNFTVLTNEHTLITHGTGRLLVAGVPDYTAGFFAPLPSDPLLAMENAPDADYRILLAHQPKSIVQAAKAGFDLMISGHTHGGQYFPWQYFVGLDQPYVAGLHTHNGTQLYVSRGIGYWGPPLRIGVPPEITLIKLRNTG